MNENLQHWYPVASSNDLPLRHVYQGQLWGRELAVWRADDGFVNVWENRCLHRGVRLSIGLNEGRELRCLYHGWRYANRTAGCTYIPAHPADAPARTICNNTYHAIEAHGLVWSSVEPMGDFAVPEALEGQETLALRPIPVKAAPELALKHAATYRFSADGSAANDTSVEAKEGGYVLLSADGAQMMLFVQPIDADRSVLRGVLINPTEDHLALLRYHNSGLSALRDVIESDAAKLPTPAAIEVSFSKVDADLAAMPERAKSGPKAELRVTVAQKWLASDGVMGFRLESLNEQLPTVQPGAHIDVHMPNGMSRQYSLTNGPGEQDHYTIGVKLEPKSRGGSECMHNAVQTGDVLAISAPRANFPLRRDATQTVLVAGGIGITPMLAMAQTLKAQNLPFQLHYFAQSEAHLSFRPILDDLGENLITHLGLSPDETGVALRNALASYDYAHHLYICGPGPMLEATRKIAGDQGWPEEAVHFEYFKNVNTIDDSSSFEVALARSALTLHVPAGKSILDVLQENGIETPSSCEQGACGTCLATVIEGEPDHQDVYLSDSEKASNSKILTCVSRSKSKRLVLDI
ncbi:Phenoxybenzoate dioxygenase subunit beta [Roseovarius albus]|uniref:Phenoxybenzoate dioxygenase subunit beta n=1 Tax=Roseovarius albus TaxID=1247867 RepID=A0A1X7A4W7_9RHOB|nr:Rieske 2Fe-2S domain-containing protein [Roseovarius albus]SLN70714.1 Phenoxybenzoate dioxygenase subunit beta [Roseovarius albus]